jgi:hypothetical protein
VEVVVAASTAAASVPALLLLELAGVPGHCPAWNAAWNAADDDGTNDDERTNAEARSGFVEELAAAGYFVVGACPAALPSPAPGGQPEPTVKAAATTTTKTAAAVAAAAAGMGGGVHVALLQVCLTH